MPEHRPPDAPGPPGWARWLDLVSLALLIVAGLAGVTGGVRIRTAFLRLSLTSPWRLIVAALGIAAIRHIAAPRIPIYHDLPRRIAGWARSIVRDDLDTHASQPISMRAAVGIVGLFSLMSAVMTYPLITRLTDGLADPGDPLLNAWALKWVAHQLIASPRHLFDGNIFAPERNTLAYSETLIAPGIIAAPLSWLGGGAVLVHNVVFLAGFIASGAGTAFLVRELTGRIGPGLAAGVAFAFAPFRFDHFPQLQMQQAQWIPLAVWAFHRVLWTGRIRDGVWLGVAVSGQLLSCMYYGVFFALYLVVFGAWLLAWRLAQWRRWIGPLAVGVITALVLFAPAANAYLGARTVVGERSLSENVKYSATLSNYVAAPGGNWIYGPATQRFGALERNLFPGLVVLGLAAVSLWPPVSVVRVAYAIGLLFAVDMTLGFNGLTYPLLYAVPPIRALRIPALAVVLVAFSLAVLAGYGAARFRSGATALLLAGAIALEGLAIPMPLTTIPTQAPAVYADLVRDNAGAPAATIVELPIDYTRSAHFEDQIYMYFSTFHWQTLVNGYSGFFPPSYLEAAALMRTFPDARSLEALKARRARYVVVHGERMSGEQYQQIVTAADGCGCGLTLVARRPWDNAEISVYRIGL